MRQANRRPYPPTLPRNRLWPVALSTAKVVFYSKSIVMLAPGQPVAGCDSLACANAVDLNFGMQASPAAMEMTFGIRWCR